MGNTVYIVQIIQFFLGILITIPNLLFVVAVLGTPKLKSAANFLLTNLAFSNLSLGIILTVVKVVDHPTTSALTRPEGTIAAVNGLVNIATLLALTTNKYISIRFPTNHMSLKSCYKVVAAIWASVAVITFCKGVIFSLQFIGIQANIFDRYMAFEVALLFIFCFAVVVIYLMSWYMLYAYKKKSVHSSEESGTRNNDANNNPSKNYSIISTVGVLLGIFLVDFIIYLGSYLAYLIYPTDDVDTSEIILTIFFTQCLLTPVVIFFRDADIWRVVKKMLMCGCTAASEFQPELMRIPSETSNNVTIIPPPKTPQTHNPTELSARATPLVDNEIRPTTPSAQPQRIKPPPDPIVPVNEPIKRLPSALPPLDKHQIPEEPKNLDDHMELREMSAASRPPTERHQTALIRPQSVPRVTVQSATPREGSHRHSSASSIRPTTTADPTRADQPVQPIKLDEVD